MHDPSPVTTFLFTDIEGSTRLWEQMPDRMRHALARHDELARAAVDGNRGTVVKTTGDGMYAVFDDPVDALAARRSQLQQALADPAQPAASSCACAADCTRASSSTATATSSGVGQPRRAHHGRRARRPDPALRRPSAMLVRDRLPPDVALRDLGSVRLRDLASPEHVYQLVHPRSAAGLPGAALAGGDAEQPAAADDVVHRPRARAGRRRSTAAEDPARDPARRRRPRQDAAVAAGGGRRARRLSRRRLVRRARPARGPALVPQAVASVLGVKEDAGKPGTRSAGRSTWRDRAAAAGPRQLRAPAAGLRGPGDRTAASGPRREDPGLQPRAAACRGRDDLSVCRRCRFPTRGRPLAAAALAQFEAVRLFVERAPRVRTRLRS